VSLCVAQRWLRHPQACQQSLFTATPPPRATQGRSPLLCADGALAQRGRIESTIARRAMKPPARGDPLHPYGLEPRYATLPSDRTVLIYRDDGLPAFPRSSEERLLLVQLALTCALGSSRWCGAVRCGAVLCVRTATSPTACCSRHPSCALLGVASSLIPTSHLPLPPSARPNHEAGPTWGACLRALGVRAACCLPAVCLPACSTGHHSSSESVWLSYPDRRRSIGRAAVGKVASTKTGRGPAPSLSCWTCVRRAAV
jgi:hypothetical protein